MGQDQSGDEVTVETTSVFRADFLNELDAPAQAGGEGITSGVEGLPAGSALLVVKRGPNAGSRFLLDQPVTAAGRHPDSDIFLTTSPSAAVTRSSGSRATSSRSSTSAVSTAPTSIGNRSIRRSWSTATKSRSGSSAWCS